MNLDDKVCYVFNKVFVSLIKDVKEIMKGDINKNNDIRVELVNNYKVFDKASNEYMLYFLKNLDDDVKRVLFNDSDILDNIEILNMNIFINITINSVLTNVIKDNESDRKKFRHYIYVLLVIAYIYSMDELDNSKREILLTKTLRVLENVNNDDITDTDMDEYLEDILDDDVKKVLWKMYENRDIVKINKDKMSGNFGDLSYLENTKIGSLAKEISDDIDLSKFQNENIESMLDINNLFSGSNNMLGDIIQSVGTKITNKIQNGELDQNDLVQEAFGIMGNMGDNDLMSQMMNMMQNNPNMMNPKENKTRTRLQKKIKNKK